MNSKFILITLGVILTLGSAIEVKYYGYDEVLLKDGKHLRTLGHNPMLEDEIGDRNGVEGRVMRRREIFGRDDRENVDRDSVDDEDRIPELATVLLSVGCTGMLITEDHVLTAAHCVYSGGQFKPGYSDLEAAIEMEYGLEWRKVLTIFLPSNWTRPDASVNPDYFDYAVLRIDPLTVRTPHLPIALSSSQHGTNSKISVVAYFDDKPKKTKWMTSCKVSDVDSGILWHKCDVTYGASGAGMYSQHLQNNEQELRTIAILSGYNFDANKQMELNYAVRINPVNYFYICSWSCQSEWCLDQLTDGNKKEIENSGDRWVLDKLNESRPPYCNDWSCQSEWCLGQLTDGNRREIENSGDRWVLDKLKESRPPYCNE